MPNASHDWLMKQRATARKTQNYVISVLTVSHIVIVTFVDYNIYQVMNQNHLKLK